MQFVVATREIFFFNDLFLERCGPLSFRFLLVIMLQVFGEFNKLIHLAFSKFLKCDFLLVLHNFNIFRFLRKTNNFVPLGTYFKFCANGKFPVEIIKDRVVYDFSTFLKLLTNVTNITRKDITRRPYDLLHFLVIR